MKKAKKWCIVKISAATTDFRILLHHRYPCPPIKTIVSLIVLIGTVQNPLIANWLPIESPSVV
jgi:hypothetical protein